MSPLLGFTKLKAKLLDDTKTQTIRKLRKHLIKVGDTLYRYWKLRTKECEKLTTKICSETFFIRIQYYEKWLDSNIPILRIDRYEEPNSLSCRTLTEFECEDLAKRDGFDSALQMVQALEVMHKTLDDKIFQVIRW